MSLELQDLFDISFALHVPKHRSQSALSFSTCLQGRMSHEQCPRRSSNVEEVVGE